MNKRQPKKRILVVDDDPVTTRLLKSVLEQTGQYDVREEHLGARVLARARRLKPDAIILDIILPDIAPAIHGGHLADKLVADPALKDTAILFLSAVVPDDDELPLPFSGNSFRFLTKPVQLDKVIACLDALLCQPHPTQHNNPTHRHSTRMFH